MPYREITFPSLERIQDRLKDHTVGGVNPESISVSQSEMDELIADLRHYYLSSGFRDDLDDWEHVKSNASVSGIRLVVNHAI